MTNLLYEMARSLGAKLQKRKFPHRVVYGRRRLPHVAFVYILSVVGRPHDLGEERRAPRGAHRADGRRAIHDLGCEIRVYARASVPGACEEDHEFDCDQVVRALVVALGEFFAGEKAGFALPSFSEARMMREDEFDEGLFEQWPGVGYVLRFRVPAAVNTRDFLSQANPTAAPTGVGGDVEIQRDGSNEPPEIVTMP